jgi:hypothetical protein
MKKNNEFKAALRLALIAVVMGLGIFYASAPMPAASDNSGPVDRSTPVMGNTPVPAGVTPTTQATPRVPKKTKTPVLLKIADAATPLPNGPTPYVMKPNPVGTKMGFNPTPITPGAQ